MVQYTPTTFTNIVTGVGEAIYTEILATGGGPEIKRKCLLVPGQIVWDDCQCGQLAQTITSVFPSNSFPAPATDQRTTACGPYMMVATVIVSMTRCTTVLAEGADPPRCVTLMDEAVKLERDRYAMYHAAACALKSLRDVYQILEFAVGTATSVGPEGGCVGVELTYSIGIATDCCE